MEQIPHVSDMEPTPEERIRWRYPAPPPWSNGEPPRTADDTQPYQPYMLPGVMVETQMVTDAPLPPVETRSLIRRVRDGLAALIVEVRDEYAAPY